MCNQSSKIPYLVKRHSIDSLGKGFVQLSKNLIKVLLPKNKIENPESLELAELSETKTKPDYPRKTIINNVWKEFD